MAAVGLCSCSPPLPARLQPYRRHSPSRLPHSPSFCCCVARAVSLFQPQTYCSDTCKKQGANWVPLKSAGAPTSLQLCALLNFNNEKDLKAFAFYGEAGREAACVCAWWLCVVPHGGTQGRCQQEGGQWTQDTTRAPLAMPAHPSVPAAPPPAPQAPMSAATAGSGTW